MQKTAPRGKGGPLVRLASSMAQALRLREKDPLDVVAEERGDHLGPNPVVPGRAGMRPRALAAYVRQHGTVGAERVIAENLDVLADVVDAAIAYRTLTRGLGGKEVASAGATLELAASKLLIRSSGTPTARKDRGRDPEASIRSGCGPAHP